MWLTPKPLPAPCGVGEIFWRTLPLGPLRADVSDIGLTHHAGTEITQHRLVQLHLAPQHKPQLLFQANIPAVSRPPEEHRTMFPQSPHRPVLLL